MFQRSGNSSQPHICPSSQNWGEELGWEWVSGRQNKSNSERVGEGQWQWQQKQLMKTMPEFPDALELSTLLILTCISMLCMRSPAAIKAKYISLIKLTDFSREVVRESKNKEDKKYWHRYDCLPRKMASINFSWVQCSFTVGFQPCIYRGGKGDDSCACCRVSSSIHHLWFYKTLYFAHYSEPILLLQSLIIVADSVEVCLFVHEAHLVLKLLFLLEPLLEHLHISDRCGII